MPTKTLPKPPVPVICIQEIETSWTKASRGGEGAVKRGYVPEAVELPFSGSYSSSTTEMNSFLLHLLSYSERTQYKAGSKLLESDVGANKSAEILNRGGVRVNFDGNFLTARYQWAESLGAPMRRRQDSTGTFVDVGHSPVQKAFELQIGQWGRILYNGRHTDYDNGMWSYDKHVFNIGLFVNPMPDIFLTTQPIKTYSKMALLFQEPCAEAHGYWAKTPSTRRFAGLRFKTRNQYVLSAAKRRVDGVFAQ